MPKVKMTPKKKDSKKTGKVFKITPKKTKKGKRAYA